MVTVVPMMVRVCRNVAVANVMPFGWIGDNCDSKHQ